MKIKETAFLYRPNGKCNKCGWVRIVGPSFDAYLLARAFPIDVCPSCGSNDLKDISAKDIYEDRLFSVRIIETVISST